MFGAFDDAIAPAKCVLVIDDEQDVREVAQVSLQVTRSWSVITAASGAEGITMAQQNQPDAILLDLYLNDMGGLKVLEVLKTDKVTAHIPVLFMTAYSESMLSRETIGTQEDRAKGLIQKPFTPTVLASQIEAALNW